MKTKPRKWEKATGIPDKVLVPAWWKYKKINPKDTADRVAVSVLKRQRLRFLCGTEYANAPEEDLGLQLLDVRKRGLLSEENKP